jgi:hypothetical protein
VIVLKMQRIEEAIMIPPTMSRPINWVAIIEKNDLSHKKPCMVGKVVSSMAD